MEQIPAPPPSSTDAEIEQDLEELKDDEDFFDITKELEKPSLKINNNTEISEDDGDFEDDTEVIEGDFEPAEFEDEDDFTDEDETEELPKNEWLNADNISGLIAAAHGAALPPLLIGGYKKIFFKIGEWSKIQSILDKQGKALAKGENFFADKKELKLLKKYHKFCKFRDEGAQLSENQINRLQKAWAYQLNKWGLNDANVNINPMLEAYGSIFLEKGASLAINQVAS